MRDEDGVLDLDGAPAKNELIDAAVLYAYAARWSGFSNMSQPVPAWARDNHGYWPFDDASWEPSEDPVTDLVTAGALIAAEIDRLQRLDDAGTANASRRCAAGTCRIDPACEPGTCERPTAEA